jgi:hypothetical protein
MCLILITASLFAAAGAAARRPAPLRDSVSLNIGINCQWRQRCMTQQQKAMQRALGFVRTQRLPPWRVQLCNRNASRGRNRVDWIGFDNCIRNAALRPPPRPAPKRRHRLF